MWGNGVGQLKPNKMKIEKKAIKTAKANPCRTQDNMQKEEQNDINTFPLFHCCLKSQQSSGGKHNHELLGRSF
jgi:Zn ribbon nucleic-acid-binding protein